MYAKRATRNQTTGRRDVLGGALALATTAAVLPTACLVAARAHAQEPSASRLILLGTQGGPNFNAARSETASAVVVDGRPYLVDCGYGTLAALLRAGLHYRQVAHVFLTHLHDDHTADLAALLGHQWTDGRVEPTTVHGPYGTRRLVEAALAFAEANVAIRFVDEDRSIKLEELVRSEEIDATAGPAPAYEDELVTVSSVENTHYPVSSKRRVPYRSLSYRFDAPDRSIVFSGDTSYSTGLIELARDADLLVCEAINVEAMRAAFEAKVAGGAYADNAEGVWRHIVATHATTEEAGRMAAEARVKKLVLNHVLPGALLDVTDDAYLDGVRRAYRGPVVVGRDQMVL